MLLILRSPWLDQTVLKSHFDRLVITVDAHIANTQTADRDTPPSTDSIFSGTVPDVNDPFILVDEGSEDDEEDDSRMVYAIWKVPIFLARPRMRLQGPAVVFSASARLKPEVTAEFNSKTKGYLQSGLPSSLNLLESFGNDPSLNGVKPRLSALRVSRVAPVTGQRDHMQSLRALPQLKLRVSPIVHTRIRFSRPNGVPSASTVLALLEVDFTPFFECEVYLDKVNMNLHDGTVEDLNKDSEMKRPLSCVAHDHITFFYHLNPSELTFSSSNQVRELEISMSASVQAIPNFCTPRLNITWRASVDFSTPVNPGYGTSGTGIQRSHKPSQLSIGGAGAITPLKSPSVTQPDALPALEAATKRTETSLPDLGITMSFTGPSETIHPGDTFSWSVYIVNRSPKASSRAPRKLALISIPKRRRNEVRLTRATPTLANDAGGKDITGAVVDEHALRKTQQSSMVDDTDVVCLSADTRVGPLAPGACHVVELQFLALKEGLLSIEAIRVVDLGSQEHVDIRELPTMMVKPIAV